MHVGPQSRGLEPGQLPPQRPPQRDRISREPLRLRHDATIPRPRRPDLVPARGSGRPEAPITAADTLRLQELAASRKERTDDQAAAAKAQEAADAAAAAAAAEAARPDAVLPVRGGRLTSGFGGRWGRLHAGIDLAAPMMTPEYSVMDGIVLEAGPSSGYGNAVYIQDADGNVHIYGHMRYYSVHAGDVVHAGDPIA